MSWDDVVTVIAVALLVGIVALGAMIAEPPKNEMRRVAVRDVG